MTEIDRARLPAPDRPYAGPIFEGAKDPEATLPSIEPLRPHAPDASAIARATMCIAEQGSD